MLFQIYPGTQYPQYREPIYRPLSAEELAQAAQEFENRKLETEKFLARAMARNNVVRRKFLSTSLLRLERQRSEFFQVQTKQAALVTRRGAKRQQQLRQSTHIAA
jgi:hypothetical protein